MNFIESLRASYHIHTLMRSAKKSVMLFAPTGWQFFSFQNYSPILFDVAELGIRARFIFGMQMFPTELNPVDDPPLKGCEIRVVVETHSDIGFVVVDERQAIKGNYIPGKQAPYIALAADADEAEITTLLKRFENSWTAASRMESLFPLPRTEQIDLIASCHSEVLGWSPRLQKLATNPTELYKLNWRDFEEVVAELLARDGFEVTLTPRTRDGGRDVLAAQTLPTGSILCLVECKRYAEHRSVGIEQVRALFGAVTAEGATNGMIVTTSSFSSPARQFARNHAYRLALKEHADLIAWLQKIRRV